MDLATIRGNHIWIIGANGGIGRALSLRLAAEGAILSLSSRDAANFDTLKSLPGSGHNFYSCDVTDPKSLADTLAKIKAASPVLDRIIFLAGDYTPMKLEDIDIETMRRIIDVNLTGAFNLIHAALPSLLSQKHGQIALCGSVSAYRGLPNGQPYSATKAALHNLAESLRAETMRRGLDVKLITPGFVRTTMTDKNTFTMPMRIEPGEAADAIVEGLCKDIFEIHFPKKFTYWVKLLKILPDKLYFKLVSR